MVIYQDATDLIEINEENEKRIITETAYLCKYVTDIEAFEILARFSATDTEELTEFYRKIMCEIFPHS